MSSVAVEREFEKMRVFTRQRRSTVLNSIVGSVGSILKNVQYFIKKICLLQQLYESTILHFWSAPLSPILDPMQHSVRTSSRPGMINTTYSQCRMNMVSSTPLQKIRFHVKEFVWLGQGCVNWPEISFTYCSTMSSRLQGCCGQLKTQIWKRSILLILLCLCGL